MPLFAVSLLSACHVAGTPPPDGLRELAIHVVQAADEAEARERGAELGAKREHTYLNVNGEDVSWVFQGVVECQDLFGRTLTDGMEVSSWLYEGDRLCLNDSWSEPSSDPG